MTTHYHFIGIGGTGLAPIARILIERGHKVSGSDRQLTPLAEEIRLLGGHVHIGHSAGNVMGADVIIRSSAILDDNVEVQAARNANVRVLKRSEFLSELIGGKTCLAVAGTHGKTTTTSMLAWVLTRLGEDPSYVIGGTPLNLASSAHDGKGKYFIIEADEYDNMFLGLSPTLAIITQLEHDHPDCFPSMEDYRHSFEMFIERILPDGELVLFADNPEMTGLFSHSKMGVKHHTYGRSQVAEFQPLHLTTNSSHCYDFDFTHFHGGSRDELAHISLAIPGEHNVMNAVSVMAAVSLIGLPHLQSAAALSEFKGINRRFEIVGSAAGVTFIEDYAHHPTEITATLTAARQRFPGQRIWAIWQPHTFSRTQALEENFISSLALADQAVITEIYAAREKNPGYSSRVIVEKINRQNVRFAAKLSDVTSLLLQELRSGDVVIVLSAGDANQINPEILKVLSEKEKK